MVNELGNVRKNCLWVVSWRETIKVAKRSSVSCKAYTVSRRIRITGIIILVTFKNGRPRLVVFIMWDDEAWGES